MLVEGATETDPRCAERPRLSIQRELQDIVRSMGFWLFEHPRMYWLPAGLPFLKLGETSIRRSFPVGPPSLTQLLHAVALVEQHQSSVLQRLHWLEAGLAQCRVVRPFAERSLPLDGTVLPIRYPILLPTAEGREQAFQHLSARGLGVSRSYPSVIQEYPELRTSIRARETPGARAVAERILTLPLHRYVTERDVDAMVKAISAIAD